MTTYGSGFAPGSAVVVGGMASPLPARILILSVPRGARSGLCCCWDSSLVVVELELELEAVAPLVVPAGELVPPAVSARRILGGSRRPKPMPDVPPSESPMVTPVVGRDAASVAGGVMGGGAAPTLPNSPIVGVFRPEGNAAGPSLGEARWWWWWSEEDMTAAAGPVWGARAGGSGACWSNGLATGARGVAWSGGPGSGAVVAEGVEGQNCWCESCQGGTREDDGRRTYLEHDGGGYWGRMSARWSE